jgi:hypothetical protein
MLSWEVTLKTGENRWSIITIEADDHLTAIRTALRLLGGTFVSVV